MIGKYLSKKANKTKKIAIKTGHLAISCAGGYVTYRAVSFVKDRMLGIGAGILVTVLINKKLS